MTISTTISEPGDFVIFPFRVENTGLTNAKVTAINNNADFPLEVTVDNSSTILSQTLATGQGVPGSIKVRWKPEYPDEEGNFLFTVTMDYEKP